jgi:glycosyltransferase involved in cell wall biosynthesis
VDLLNRDDLRAFQPLATQQPVKLVYVGGFETWHGINNLLHALAAAREQGANVTLDLIGAGPEQGTIETTIRTLRLTDIVRLTGFVDIQTLSRYLAAADIGLCPYCGRVEYSGLKLLDYKAAGLATIASGANGQPVVLRQGETGWIVPPCDIAALTTAILQLSYDHEWRRRMGQTARMEAEREHSWRQTALRLEAIFQRLQPTAALLQNEELSPESGSPTKSYAGQRGAFSGSCISQQAMDEVGHEA